MPALFHQLFKKLLTVFTICHCFTSLCVAFASLTRQEEEKIRAGAPRFLILSSCSWFRCGVYSPFCVLLIRRGVIMTPLKRHTAHPLYRLIIYRFIMNIIHGKIALFVIKAINSTTILLGYCPKFRHSTFY